MHLASRPRVFKLTPYQNPNHVFGILKARDVRYSGLVARVVYKLPFTASKTPSVRSIVKSTKELGLPSNAPYCEVYQAARAEGNRLCSPQFVFRFIAEMAGFSPNGTFVHFASEPILIDGKKYIITAFKDGKSTKLKMVKYFAKRRCSGETIWVFTA